MSSRWAVAMAIAFIAVAAAVGFAHRNGRFKPAMDRINAAVGVDPRVDAMARKLDADLQDAPQQKSRIDREVQAAMHARARLCASNVVPAWWHSQERIRQMANDRRCFAAHDDRLLLWLGLQRVRAALARPALVPIPQVPPRSMEYPGLLDVAFTSDAAVAAVRSRRSNSVSVHNMLTGQAYVTESKPHNAGTFQLSPNGRLLFDHGLYGPLRFVLTETGETLATIEDVWGYALLGQQYLLLNQNDKRTMVWNLDQRERWQVQELEDLGVHAAYPVQDVPGRFVLVCGQQILVVDVKASDALATSLTIAQRYRFANAINGGSFEHLMADKQTLLVAGANLNLLDLKTQQLTTTEFAPAAVQWVWPAPDGDAVVLKVGIDGPGGSYVGPFLYRIKDRTFSKVRQIDDNSTVGLVWVAPFRSLG